MTRRIRTVDQWSDAYTIREKIEDLLAEIWEDRPPEDQITRYELIEKLSRIRNLTFKLENIL